MKDKRDKLIGTIPTLLLMVIFPIIVIKIVIEISEYIKGLGYSISTETTIVLIVLAIAIYITSEILSKLIDNIQK